MAEEAAVIGVGRSTTQIAGLNIAERTHGDVQTNMQEVMLRLQIALGVGTEAWLRALSW